MSAFEVFETIERMRRSKRPFCVATVVRTADVTSAKAGAKAVVTEQGDIKGHLGGACLQRAVRSAAERALAKGEAQLIRVKPSEDVTSATDTDGVALFKSGCPSGGTVDVLVEAYHHPPTLVVFGTTAIAREVIIQAQRCDFRVIAPHSLSGEVDAAEYFDAPALDALDLTDKDFVVIASQGNGDAAALRSAWLSGAGRISMVASRRKADALMADLGKAEAINADPSRLKSPAGLDIGAIDPSEIANSIIAELIQWRRATT